MEENDENIVNCKKHVQNLIESDEKFQSLFKLNKISILCKKCTNEGLEGLAKAYIKTMPLTVVLCTNRIENNNYRDSLMHEFVHAYDYKRGVDFSDCKGLAYSEVRASREGECKNTYPIDLVKKYCIKKNAKLSTRNLFPQQGDSCVKEVFDLAMKDLAPFENE